MKVDLILWRDAAQWDDDHGDEVFEGEGVMLRSVGFVTGETDEVVFLTRDICSFPGSTPYRRTVAIPKGMIIKRIRLTNAEEAED